MYPTPLNYKIHFSPDLSNKIFSADEVISFKVSNNTSSILLNLKDLEIEQISLEDNKIEYTINNDDLILNFYQELKSDQEYKLNIKYHTEFKEELAGWYLSKYQDNDKEESIATSQFESSDARRAFICVDHPLYKATFDISFTIDKDLSAISNTLSIKEDIKGNKKFVEFATSPLMSTYLLYLGVGNFEYLEDKYNEIVIRGVTTPGKKQYTVFAVDITKKVLKYFEDYFDFKYPLSKLDLIAVPDFAAGAMENWGAITFRESGLLYYPESTSISKKNYIVEVIAHELAHQWFGNLVTMKWWNDLWLNESFATFMAFKVMDHYWKEWDVWTQYLVDTTFASLDLDSMHSSHPIQVEVKSIDEVGELFDEIAYEKGGSILRMLENFVGEENFRKGLQKYINTYKYKNAEGKDLWNTLESVSKESVSEFMLSFTNQTGFPVVNVELEKNTLKLSQHRFTLLPLENNNQSWVIPLVIKKDNKVQREIIKEKETIINIDNESTLININNDYTGFFISNYSDDLLISIQKEYQNLNNKNRLGIINDLSYLLFSNKISLFKFINFIEDNLYKEKDYFVLNLALTQLFKAYKLISDNFAKETLFELAQYSLTLVNTEPSENEAINKMILRNNSLAVLVKFDDIESINFIKNKFESYKKDSKSLHSNLAGIVYILAVKIDTANWDYALERYMNSDIQDEKFKFLESLGASIDSTQIKKTLDLCLSDKVRFSNIVYPFKSLSSNAYAKDIVLEWIFANWENLLNNSGGMAGNLLRIILKLSLPVFGIGNEDKVKAFLEKYKNENLSKTFDQVLEELEINSRFVKANTK